MTNAAEYSETACCNAIVMLRHDVEFVRTRYLRIAIGAGTNDVSYWLIHARDQTH